MSRFSSLRLSRSLSYSERVNYVTEMQARETAAPYSADVPFGRIAF
jgi:hypothetical protein